MMMVGGNQYFHWADLYQVWRWLSMYKRDKFWRLNQLLTRQSDPAIQCKIKVNSGGRCSVLDFLKELWKPVASNLKAPIFVFAILVLILGLVFALSFPEYLAWILGVMAVLIFVAIRVYFLLEQRQPPAAAPQSESPKPVKETPPAQTPKPTTPTPVSIPVENLRESYLDSVIVECQRARLVGLDPQSADPRRKAFPLDKLYVELDTKTKIESKKKREKPVDFTGDTEPLSALAALENSQDGKMVLLGLPGSGKTTFVRYLSLRHALALRHGATSVADELPGWQGPPLLPVIIPLGRFAEALPKDLSAGKTIHVEQFLQQSLKTSEDDQLSYYADHIVGDLHKRPVLFLFDGLDEVADLALRPRVVQAVEAFTESYRKGQPSHRFLVTCRTFSYTDPSWQLAGWQTHELAPLTEPKINQFIDAWHDQSIHVDPARREDYEVKRTKLKTALRRGDPRRLWEIAENPLILTLMAVVHTTRGELPDARALVYEECTRQLLIQWEAERPVRGKSQRTDLKTALGVLEITLDNVLQEVAYHAHERPAENKDRSRPALVTEDLLRADLFAAFGSAEKVQIFINYCESANGLLQFQGIAPLPGAPPDSPLRRIYTFPHLTFQEYLSARYVRRLPNLGDSVRAHLNRSDRWREVVLLLGEHICFKEGDWGLMDSVLHALVPLLFPKTPNDKDWRALWAAGDLLVLYRRAFPQRTNQHSHITNHLTLLLKTGALTPQERVAAGSTLDRLGDPRFDPQHWYLPHSNVLVFSEKYPDVFGFVPIPAGPFLMGSLHGEKEAFDDEYEQHERTLPDFYLARTPVTVAQFQAFVADAQPKLEGKPLLGDGANTPVVNVSWNDAVVYCQWLTTHLQELAAQMLNNQTSLNAIELVFWQRLGQDNWQVMLPSEAEWEKVARGPLSKPPNPYIYPWGSDFDPDCANIDETRINDTSAVGCFPKGRSSYDVLDLSGNVWEWTRSLDKPYPYQPGDGREYSQTEGMRVLRGGSFDDFRILARCAYRFRYNPNYWFDSCGFRVGVVSNIF
jgi:formylglycine-generating enzyme required for sulfatase activity